MSTTETRPAGLTTSLPGALGVLTLIVLSVVGLLTGLETVLAVAWIAFGAMAGGAALGARAADPSGETAAASHGLLGANGIASGAMITSASVFLLPQAIGYEPRLGGVGVALGLLAGYGAHAVGHATGDRALAGVVGGLSAHAFAAGAIIGLVYATMPTLGPLLGVAIVSHKAPAGYVAARRLGATGRSWQVLLVPAAGVGIAAILTGALGSPTVPAVNALVFGFATGIFLQVAMDFLPDLDGERDDSQSSDATDGVLDRHRVRAVSSTALGAIAVVLAWGLVH